MVAPRILFVCLGNICRSPLAEAAFRQAAAEVGLAVEADSAGMTGSFHHVLEAHLHRYLCEYLCEFNFRWNTRQMTDRKQMSASIGGIVGRRLTYGELVKRTSLKK